MLERSRELSAALLAQLDIAAERLRADLRVAVTDASLQATAGSAFLALRLAVIATDIAAERLRLDMRRQRCRQTQMDIAAHRFQSHARVRRRCNLDSRIAGNSAGFQFLYLAGIQINVARDRLEFDAAAQFFRVDVTADGLQMCTRGDIGLRGDEHNLAAYAIDVGIEFLRIAAQTQLATDAIHNKRLAGDTGDGRIRTDHIELERNAA